MPKPLKTACRWCTGYSFNEIAAMKNREAGAMNHEGNNNARISTHEGNESWLIVRRSVWTFSQGKNAPRKTYGFSMVVRSE